MWMYVCRLALGFREIPDKLVHRSNLIPPIHLLMFLRETERSTNSVAFHRANVQRIHGVEEFLQNIS